jgi:hypothetical protein
MAGLGAIGLGFVWGWLMGSVGGRVRRPLPTGLALGSATLLLTAEVLVLAHSRAVWLFLGGAGLALLLHLGWRRELSDHFGRPRD